MADIKYEVTGEYGVISDNGKGTVMKLRTVSWNDRPAKFDLRSWYTAKDGSEGMNKGITLTKEELLVLGDLIDKIRKEEEKPKTKAKSAACNARITSRTTKASVSTTKSTTKAKATVKKGTKK